MHIRPRPQPGRAEAGVTPDDAIDLLVGSRTCMQGGTVSDDMIDRLADSIGTWH